MRIARLVRDLHRQDSGQDLLEYALVMATVLAAVVAGSNGVANLITSALNTVTGRIQTTVS
jgi:Flp pilus assembly pilin Flp